MLTAFRCLVPYTCNDNKVESNFSFIDLLCRVDSCCYRIKNLRTVMMAGEKLSSGWSSGLGFWEGLCAR